MRHLRDGTVEVEVGGGRRGEEGRGGSYARLVLHTFFFPLSLSSFSFLFFFFLKQRCVRNNTRSLGAARRLLVNSSRTVMELVYDPRVTHKSRAEPTGRAASFMPLTPLIYQPNYCESLLGPQHFAEEITD